MLKQRQVGMLFDLCVRAIGAARFTMVAVPIAALLVVAAVSLREGDRFAAEADPLSEAGAPVQPTVLASAFAPRFALPAAPSGVAPCCARCPKVKLTSGRTAAKEGGSFDRLPIPMAYPDLSNPCPQTEE